jgi:hypothetical protein
VNGDHIYNTSYTLTPRSRGARSLHQCGRRGERRQFPARHRTRLLADHHGLQSLARDVDTWDKAIVNGNLPTLLDGVSVNVGSKPAYVNYISPTQINVQAPDVGTGPVPVTVTTPNGTSVAVTANVVAQAPAFFLWPGSQAVATRNADGSWR